MDFRPHERLRSGTEFRRVFAQGIRLEGAFFLLVAMENGRGYSRLGLAASRRVGGAVTRNRVRRLLRETFRLNRSAEARGFDLVLVPRSDMVTSTRSEVEREYRKRLRRLAARRGTAPLHAPSPDPD
jgi:ribonuclease P protein component